MKRRSTLGALLCTWLLPAAAQTRPGEPLYRADQPQVLSPWTEQAHSRSAPKPQELQQARNRYREAGQPRYLLMWNRDLSDNVGGVESVSAERTSIAMPGVMASQGTVEIRFQSADARQVSFYPPRRAHAFEVGFQQGLRDLGVRIVDRNTAIRMLAAGTEASPRGGHNLQTLEAQALARYAEAFIEIQFIESSSEPHAMQPRLTAIHSGTGEILADLYDGDAPPSPDDQRRVWLASERGFQQARLAPDDQASATVLAQRFFARLHR